MKPGVHSRQTVATLLWPETTEPRAAKNLRNALSNLRKLVGTHLDITRQTVAFKRKSDYMLDVEQFSARLERYRRGQEDIGDLETAVSLYAGDFLDGFHVPESVTYEEWLDNMKFSYKDWEKCAQKLKEDVDRPGQIPARENFVCEEAPPEGGEKNPFFEN